MSTNESPTSKDTLETKMQRVYTLYRESLWNHIFFQRKLLSERRVNTAIEFIQSFASSGAVAGWAFWHASAGEWVWGLLVGLAAVLAIYRQAARLTDRIERLSALTSAYGQMYLQYEQRISDIQVSKGIEAMMEKALAVLEARYQELGKLDVPYPKSALDEECWNEVNEKVPPSTLWLPK